jgi:menaquinone-9 beta-reductase
MRSAAADVIVAGAGPAGSAVAALLARRGVRVLLLDRARFPRRKVCAECLSPEAARPLESLGVLEQVESAGAARLYGWTVRAPGGAILRGRFDAPHGWTAARPYGLALPRERLDSILLSAARDAGARVQEGVRVADLLRNDEGRVCGVRVMDGAKMTELRARLVIGADGLRSVVARRAGLARTARWPRRIALVAHYSGIEGLNAHGELFADTDGYLGIASVGGTLANVALVVPASRGREIAGNAGSFATSWLRARPYLAERLRGARRASPTLATGPFASHSRRSWSPGVALVGDAADFFDPFTGEGVYAALRGAELLAGELAANSGGDAPLPEDDSALDASLAAYHRARHQSFSGKWKLERIIGAAVASPVFMNAAVRALARREDLADLLVGATGDFVPPRAILNAPFVARMIGAAASSMARRQP